MAGAAFPTGQSHSIRPIPRQTSWTQLDVPIIRAPQTDQSHPWKIYSQKQALSSGQDTPAGQAVTGCLVENATGNDTGIVPRTTEIRNEYSQVLLLRLVVAAGCHGGHVDRKLADGSLGAQAVPHVDLHLHWKHTKHQNVNTLAVRFRCFATFLYYLVRNKFQEDGKHHWTAARRGLKDLWSDENDASLCHPVHFLN